MTLEEALAKIEEQTKLLEEEKSAREKALKTAETRKAERIETEKKLAELAKKIEGIDPDKYAQMVKEAEEREEAELEEGKKYAELKAKQEKTVAELQGKLSETEQKSKQQLLNLQKTMAFTKAGGDPDQLDNFLSTSGNYFDLNEEGDLIVTPGSVSDEKGTAFDDIDGALGHLSKNSSLAVFFKAEDQSRGHGGNGGDPGMNEDDGSLPEGISFIDA